MDPAKTRRLVATLLVAGLAGILVLATPSGLGAGAEPPAVVVELRNWAFQPDTVAASPGSVLVIVNRDPWDHLITVEGDFRGPVRVPPGGSVRIPLASDGEMGLRCLHYSRGTQEGMVALVRVGAPPDLGDGPGATPAPKPGGPRYHLFALQLVGLAAPLAVLASVVHQQRHGDAPQQSRNGASAPLGSRRGRGPRRMVQFPRL